MGTEGVYGWLHGQPDSGVSYFRITEPMRVVGELTKVSWGFSLTPFELDDCDTIIVHAVHDEDRSRTWQWLASQQTHRLIMDVDDAVWSPDFKPMRDHYLEPGNLERFYANVAASHVVTTPSEVIADHLRRWNRNVWVVPNTVPRWLTDWTMPDREGPTIGFQGSDSHRVDWTASQEKHMSRFMNEHPDWHLHTFGGHKVESASARVHHTPWQGSVEAYWKSVSMDVGVGPLRDTLFNRCKSDLRAREYMALGIVPVLPFVGPYRKSFVDGHTGRFVYGHQTLSGVLREVARDPAQRAAMSAAAREVARRDFTTEGNLERIVEAWTSA